MEAKKEGQEAVEDFVMGRMVLNKTGVFAPITRAERKTFASSRKRLSKTKGKKSNQCRYEFFSRLLIFANTKH